MRFFEKLVKNIEKNKEVHKAKREIDRIYFDMTDYDLSTCEYIAKRKIGLSLALDRCNTAISIGREGQERLASTYDIKGLGLEKKFNCIEGGIGYIEHRKEILPQIYDKSTKEL